MVCMVQLFVSSDHPYLFSNVLVSHPYLRFLIYKICSFLGAAVGSLNIVLISNSGMLRSSEIHIILIPTRYCNKEFIIIIFIARKNMADFECRQLEIGLECVR